MGESSLLLLAKFVPLLFLFLLFLLDSSGSKSRSLAKTLSEKENGALSRFISQLYGGRLPPEASLNCNNYQDPSVAVVILCSDIDSGYHVTEIDASSVNLNGSISKDVSELKYLRRLDLYNNKLQGYIHREIGRLFYLTSLDLSDNQLNGSIPASLGSLSNLSVLYLYNNKLDGVIPDELGSLYNLTTILDLSYNQLTGPIPQTLGSLKSLESLDLSYNQLTGHIPQGLGSLKSLKYLDLSHNQLIGPIPQGLGSFKNLTYLSLRLNLLDGGIPQSLYDLSSLTYLYLWRNKLSGQISSEIGRLSQLEVLALNDNEFNGTLPKELGSLKKLRALTLGSNYFTGELPTETEYYTNLTNLRTFGVCGNNLTGAINPLIAKWSNLTILCLLGNNFKELPRVIFNMSNLTTLMVSDLVSQPALQLLNFKKLQGLQSLILRNSNIQGRIPDDIDKWLTQLEYMDLSFNNLSGKIPKSMGNLSLKALFLTGNILEGSISDKIKNITIRDLSQNNFDEVDNKDIM